MADHCALLPGNIYTETSTLAEDEAGQKALQGLLTHMV